MVRTSDHFVSFVGDLRVRKRRRAAALQDASRTQSHRHSRSVLDRQPFRLRWAMARQVDATSCHTKRRQQTDALREPEGALGVSVVLGLMLISNSTVKKSG